TADDAPDPAPSEPAEPAAPRGPPRALLVGVAAALAFVLVAAGVAVVAKKWLHRAPPAAAVKALAQAQDLAAKDTMTSLVQGESSRRQVSGGGARARRLLPRLALAHEPRARAEARRIARRASATARLHRGRGPARGREPGRGHREAEGRRGGRAAQRAGAFPA